MKPIDKPRITQEIYNKWQRKIDLMCSIIDVPVGLIMKVHPTEIEVFVSSDTPDNPYNKGEREELNIGLYCETVMATRKMLHIPNALEDDQWKDNPDIKLGMISYVGAPLLYPNGDLFGTVCILDRNPREFSSLQKEILEHFRDSCETDIKLEGTSLTLEGAIQELHHE